LNNDIKLLGSNITFFGLIQLSQYLIPIITMPYLLRIIGFDNYGLIAFSQAIIGILLVVTDYGFNISGPRYVSSKQNDLDVLNNYFLKVIFAKLILLFISLIFILLMSLVFNSFRENQLITYLLLMIVLGNVFNPTWFFQGMENIKPVALINLSFRCIYVACIFIFINKESDYLLVPLLMGLSFLLPGILNLLLCVKIYKLKIYSIDFFQLIEIIKSDFEIFKSRISVALYIACVPLTLGIISTPSILAAYTVA
jgi:PST family polysaccharide transporter